ncbi:hypothetical protein [Acuticoccus sediminis]|uniref:hypothetical protein n=1 Tax=Acuticoccus sediminis TaxID=2184697 RepID=UPI0011B941AE|nr:hypothetical protein [Acuticoccus sediminis]
MTTPHRIAVLGNSHVGALKSGWDRIHANYDNVEITFFAARAAKMLGMLPNGDRLTPESENLANFIAFTSGGPTEVVASDHDIFVIHGMGLKLRQALCRGQPGLSAAVCAAIFRDTVLSNNAMIMASRLRQIGASPIMISHNPLPTARNEDVNETEDYNTVANRLEAALGEEDFSLIRVPDVLCKGLTTPQSFSVGSERLAMCEKQVGVRHGDEEHLHMNADWGEIWMRHFLNSLNLPRIRSVPKTGITEKGA